MSYIPNNDYFVQLNGSTSNRVNAGSNGAGSGIKGVLDMQEDVQWLSSNLSKNNFTTTKEIIIQGSSSGTNSNGDFYHLYKVTGDNLYYSHSGQTNAEAAANFSKIDEDVLSISGSGTFSFEVIGKYNSGYFCDENTKLVLIRIEY